MADTDSRMMDRAAEGDKEALARLLEHHGPEVRQKVVGHIPQRWQALLSADDVMQETYIDAFLDVGQFEPRGDGSFVAWLLTLARRNLLDAVRMLDAEKRGGGRKQIANTPGESSLLSAVEQLTGVVGTPSQHAARREAGVRLQAAIEQLPENYRTVVSLYDLEGRSVEDVAAVLERSPGAVFMLRARALRQIAGLLGAASMYLSGR